MKQLSGSYHIVNYRSFEDAVYKFNEDNRKGLILQVAGLGVVFLGSIVTAIGSSADGNAGIYVGSAIVVVGGVISLAGLIKELSSHKHLIQYQEMTKAKEYKP